MYADVTVVVDGAVEQEERFHDEALLRDFVAGVEEDAKGDGYPTEVFVVEHDHDESDEECACVQFLQDHKPYAEFNTAS